MQEHREEDHQEEGLEDSPRDPEHGLLVAHEDVSLREDEQQLAVLPELGQAKPAPAPRGLDHAHGRLLRGEGRHGPSVAEVSEDPVKSVSRLSTKNGCQDSVRSLSGRSRNERQEWRERNSERLYEPSELQDPGPRGLYERLHANGVAIGRFEELFGSRELFDEAAAQARQIYDRHLAEPQAASLDDKSFLTSLLGKEFEASDPFVRIALHPNVLAVVNRYLELRSMLRALELWLSVTTPGPAVQTQLWHRDGDDLMNAKLFVYFSDVGLDSGPFTYAPATHPVGERRELPERNESGRSTDEQMARVVPGDEWVVCTGEAGTIVLADTCGYHKQLKPEGGQRLCVDDPVHVRHPELPALDRDPRHRRRGAQRRPALRAS